MSSLRRSPRSRNESAALQSIRENLQRNNRNRNGSTNKNAKDTSVVSTECDSSRRVVTRSSTRRRNRRSSSASNQRSSSPSDSAPPTKRRSMRGRSSLKLLAESIRQGHRVVLITGAGLSVASGVRPFRSSSSTTCRNNIRTNSSTSNAAGLWDSIIWTMATREAFRKDPLEWYNDFWMPHFCKHNYKPNAAHYALQALQDLPNAHIRVITQNVDGLQQPGEHLIEAHGRVGYYKCLPQEDSEDDDSTASSSSSDSCQDTSDSSLHKRRRRIRLGSRRRSHRQHTHSSSCKYQSQESLTLDQLVFSRHAEQHRQSLTTGQGRLTCIPHCCNCGQPVLPQALLFDEAYHHHAYYQFEKMEQWLQEADILVFVGTSCQVSITRQALDHARDYQLPVYNLNTVDMMEPTLRLNVENIPGPSEQTLPELLQLCVADPPKLP